VSSEHVYSCTHTIGNDLTGTFFSGFYGTLQLASSRLFQLKSFSLPHLKPNRQEMNTIRLVTVMMSENIPQMCIQVAFLVIDSNAGPNVVFFAALSLAFTTISIISCVLQHLLKVDAAIYSLNSVDS